MTENEKVKLMIALEQELYQVKMRLLDYRGGDSGYPTTNAEQERFRARKAEIEKRLAELE